MPAGDGNLFADLARRALAPAERIEALWTAPGLRLERIISFGQASPPGFWYDQPWAEWVLLLTGSAGLRFADEPEPRSLRPGDHLLIPPHRRHRVEWTAPDEPSVWLALHLAPPPGEGG